MSFEDLCSHHPEIFKSLKGTQINSAYPNRNLNRKLEISTAPTGAKLREPAYSQALIQNKIDKQRVRSRESGRQADSQTAMMDGVWS